MDDVERCFHDHAQSLHRYLVRLTGDADLAADGVQETFVKLIARGGAAGIERSWLYTVATNAVLSDLRGRERRRRLIGASPDRAPMADASLTPHERLEASERHDATVGALAGLSEKERTALLMREEGFSHREIAEAVGTTTGSVGTLLARALLKFTEALPASARAL